MKRAALLALLAFPAAAQQAEGLVDARAAELRGLDKIVYMVGAAVAPTSEGPSLLHYAQLQQLLQTVGVL